MVINEVTCVKCWHIVIAQYIEKKIHTYLSCSPPTFNQHKILWLLPMKYLLNPYPHSLIPPLLAIVIFAFLHYWKSFLNDTHLLSTSDHTVNCHRIMFLNLTISLLCSEFLNSPSWSNRTKLKFPAFHTSPLWSQPLTPFQLHTKCFPSSSYTPNNPWLSYASISLLILFALLEFVSCQWYLPFSRSHPYLLLKTPLFF